jgi:serine protease Do
MRFVHNAAIVAALGAASVSWSCNGRGLAASAPGDQAPQAAVPTSRDRSPPLAAVSPRTETPDVARTLSRAFAATAKAVRASVVRIDVRKQRPAIAQGRGYPWGGGPPFGNVPPSFLPFQFGGAPDSPGPATPLGGTGSGILIDSAGNVVTNSHVVDGFSEIEVTLSDGQQIPARLIGKDSRTDVAVVRLERVPKDLVAARLGDSNQIEVGEWVLAIGSPLGLEQTVTAGIVSGKGHVGRFVRMSGDRVREYIQTDAKINPGNSGGPLVNLDGEVVGLNTLIKMGAGGAYGFAVPVNEVRRVAQALLVDGRVRYPYFGVSVRDLDSLEGAVKEQLGPKAPSQGAYVTVVTRGGPAAAAGLRQGDVITKLDGEAIRSSADVVDYVSSRALGASMTVTLFRAGDLRQLSAKVTASPGDSDDRNEVPALGLTLQSLTPLLAGSFGLPPGTRGVAIAEVAPGSPGARAGLQAGDVILDVDRRPVVSAEDASRTIGGAMPHLLRVFDRAGIRFVTVQGGG